MNRRSQNSIIVFIIGPASANGKAEFAKQMTGLLTYLMDDVPLEKGAADARILIRTARRWLAGYRAGGPAVLGALQKEIEQGIDSRERASGLLDKI